MMMQQKACASEKMAIPDARSEVGSTSDVYEYDNGVHAIS